MTLEEQLTKPVLASELYAQRQLFIIRPRVLRKLATSDSKACAALFVVQGTEVIDIQPIGSV